MLLLRLVAGGRGRRDPAFAHKGSNPGACCCKMPGKADRSLGFCNTVVGPKVDLFVFDRAPNPLDEDVVAPGAFAVPADRNGVVPQQTGDRDAGELATLVGIEISGLPYWASAASTASRQKATARVIDTRQDSTLRLNQSTTAAR